MPKSKKEDAKKTIDDIGKKMEELLDVIPFSGSVAVAYDRDNAGEFSRVLAYGNGYTVAVASLFLIAKAAEIIEEALGEFPAMICDEIEAVYEGADPRNILPEVKDAVGAGSYRKPVACDGDEADFLPVIAHELMESMERDAQEAPALNLLGSVYCPETDSWWAVGTSDAEHALDSIFALVAELRDADFGNEYEAVYDIFQMLVRDVIEGANPVEVVLEEITENLAAGEDIDELMAGMPLFQDVDDAIEKFRALADMIVDQYPETHIISGVSYTTPTDETLFNLIFSSPAEDSTFIILAIINQYYEKMREHLSDEEFRGFRSLFPRFVERICAGESLERLLTYDDEPEPRNRAERRRMQRNKRG